MSALRIDGKNFADTILNDLSNLVKRRDVRPQLVVILVGNNAASLSYIRQKQSAAARIGAKCTLLELPETTSSSELATIIQQLNRDPKATGIVIQRPLPQTSQISEDILQLVSPKKDVDGFVPHTLFTVPVAEAVVMLLDYVYKQTIANGHSDFINWIMKQHITVIGRGETAGKPVADTLNQLSIPHTVIHSQTEHPESVLKSSSIIISCVGKENSLQPQMISPNAILISVGLSRGTDNKLHGDYEEDAIKDIALAYTPTPGGVGPVNVACLMKNLVKALTMDTLTA